MVLEHAWWSFLQVLFNTNPASLNHWIQQLNGQDWCYGSNSKLLHYSSRDRYILSYLILRLYSVRITLNIDRWIKTRESQHLQPLDLLFHFSIQKILLIVSITMNGMHKTQNTLLHHSRIFPLVSLDHVTRIFKFQIANNR